MEFLSAYGLFAAKAVTVVICFGLLVAIIAASSSKNKLTDSTKGSLKITRINDLYDEFSDQLKKAVLSAKDYKHEHKELEKQRKQKDKKSIKEGTGHQGRLFWLDFNGDIKASAVENLRKEITGVLLQATKDDEVFVSLESAGGMVHAYGLASSQLQRIKDAGIPLTICVDKVAASGGYMMACIADRILAAPFAVVGSIGVVAQMPNVHRLLKKHDVDYELFTAGKYKRTVTVFGENTEEGKQKFQDDLEMTHQLFKDFVFQHRPALNIEEVANGDIWYGSKALENGLIDEISSSDSYLMDKFANRVEIYKVSYELPKKFAEKIGFNMEASFRKAILSVLAEFEQKKWFS